MYFISSSVYKCTGCHQSLLRSHITRFVFARYASVIRLICAVHVYYTCLASKNKYVQRGGFSARQKQTKEKKIAGSVFARGCGFGRVKLL